MHGAIRAVDWLIVLCYLSGLIGAGFVFSRRNKSADAYFKGGGKLPWWATAFSLYAALFSPITFLSVPALVFSTDMSYYPIFIGAVIPLIVAVKWFLPFFHGSGLTSAYEFLERRFNLVCRIFASLAFIAFMISLTAIVAYLPSVALSAVTGLDVNLSILVVMAVAVVYTALGGMAALVWTDFIQAIIIFVSMISIIWVICSGTDGGLSGVFAVGAANDKINAFNFVMDWTRPCFWVVFTGGIVSNLVSRISDQRVIQRYMTVKDVHAAAKSNWTQVAIGYVSSNLCFFIGLGLWSYYHTKGVFPALAKNDQLIPVFIANELPVGIAGLALAAIAAASVSTLSANMNSTAAAFTVDFYRRIFKGRNDLFCGKVASLVCGVIGCVFAIVLANTEVASAYEHFQRYLGILTAGLACLFLMGRFMPRVNGFGAVCGLVANYVVTFGLNALSFEGKPHMLIYGLLGMVTCLLVAPVMSIAGRWLGIDRK